MPIRIRKDKGFDDGGENRRRRPSNNGGGGSGIGRSLLPMLIGFLIKKPKLILPAILIGGIYFFFVKGCDSNSGGGGVTDIVQNLLSKGATLDEKVYDKAEVFEPLANTSKNTLPEQVSLAQYCPPRQNQGRQGSCVGWASSYAARSILHNRATGEKKTFSPSFVYNQIALTDCQGSYLLNAMKTMHTKGDVFIQDFPYTDQTCGKEPNSSDFRKASQYKIKGYNRLSKGGNNYKVDMLAMKQNLAQGAPVVIGMMVGGSFMQGMSGKKVWEPSNSDYNMRGFGGHAMCVIGYDDFLKGGSFQIMNSWGPEWGENGIAWVTYRDFEHFTKEAYGLYPMGNAKAEAARFEVEFGIVMNKGKKVMPLKKVGQNYFESVRPMQKDQDFKIEVTNSVECYTYVFGQETDGSSYVLFPYTQKHSPYCGITGTRFFPKDHSFYSDGTAVKSFMAVVVTKSPIDYTALNKKISSATGSYAQKVQSALGAMAHKNVKFYEGGNVKFSCEAKSNEAVGVVIGFE